MKTLEEMRADGLTFTQPTGMEAMELVNSLVAVARMYEDLAEQLCQGGRLPGIRHNAQECVALRNRAVALLMAMGIEPTNWEADPEKAPHSPHSGIADGRRQR